MYSISNIKYHKLYDAAVCEFINYFYSKEELIKFIAYHYRHWWNDLKFIEEYGNSLIEQCTCNIKELFELNNFKRYTIYDNYNRIINIKDFENEAFNLYKQLKKKNNSFSFNYILWRWEHFKIKYSFNKVDCNYRYRKDPVPRTGKRRGGPSWHPPHTAGLKRMYSNPEYKDFNRRSFKGIPNWWDDRYRQVQKSWKKQRKCRHQWEKNLS